MALIKLTEFVTVFLILFEVICKIGKCNSLCFNKLQICLCVMWNNITSHPVPLPVDAHLLQTNPGHFGLLYPL